MKTATAIKQKATKPDVAGAALLAAVKQNPEIKKKWKFLRLEGADDFTIRGLLKQTWSEPCKGTIDGIEYSVEVSHKGPKITSGKTSITGTNLINVARSKLSIEVPDQEEGNFSVNKYVALKADALQADVLLAQRGPHFQSFYKEGFYEDGKIIKDVLNVSDEPLSTSKKVRRIQFNPEEIEMVKQKLVAAGYTVAIATSDKKGGHAIEFFPPTETEAGTNADSTETPEAEAEAGTNADSTETPEIETEVGTNADSTETPEAEASTGSAETPEVEDGISYLQEVRPGHTYLPEDAVIVWESADGILTEAEQEEIISQHEGENIVFFMQSHAGGTNMKFVSQNVAIMREGMWNWYGHPFVQTICEFREKKTIWRIPNGTKRTIGFVRELGLSPKYIPVTFDEGGYQDAWLAAIAANQEHEQQLSQVRTMTTKRLNFLRALCNPAFAQKSQNAVARHVGIAQSTIVDWLKWVSTNRYFVTGDPKEKSSSEDKEKYKITDEQQAIIEKWLGARNIIIESKTGPREAVARKRSSGGGGGGPSSLTPPPGPIQSPKPNTIEIAPNSICITVQDCKAAYVNLDLAEGLEGLFSEKDERGNLVFIPSNGDLPVVTVTPESLRFVRQMTDEDKAKYFKKPETVASSDAAATAQPESSTPIAIPSVCITIEGCQYAYMKDQPLPIGVEGILSDTDADGNLQFDPFDGDIIGGELTPESLQFLRELTEEEKAKYLPEVPNTVNNTPDSTAASNGNGTGTANTADTTIEYEDKLARLLKRTSELEVQIMELSEEKTQVEQLNSSLIEIVQSVKNEITDPEIEEEFSNIPEAQIATIRKRYNTIHETVHRI